MKTYFFTFFAILSYIFPLSASLSENEAEIKLRRIHRHLSLVHGSFRQEYPEQVMAVMYISKRDKVLELGGNVGRNSCVIASLLRKSRGLVVVESDPASVSKLIENRNHNNLQFHVEDSAISQVPLIQSGWFTIPSNEPIPGFFSVKTISYEQLKKKYSMTFDVLVADCEGALYYIFNDDESLLDDVHTAIIENDYPTLEHFRSVESKLIAHGFQLVYNKSGGFGPCFNEFYQVWQKY